MAWTYTTKAKVVSLSKCATADLQDEWSNWVEKLIDKWTGTTYVATTSYTSEVHSGDGTSSVFVDHPPIVSVSSIVVDDGAVASSEYVVFSHWVELTTYPTTLVADALYYTNAFPVGVGNIEISYVGGSATVPANVELAATQMVGAIAMVADRQGADLSLKYSRMTENTGDAETVTERLGLQATLRSIMRAYLGPRVMIR